jgi:hypothetical protein
MVEFKKIKIGDMVRTLPEEFFAVSSLGNQKCEVIGLRTSRRFWTSHHLYLDTTPFRIGTKLTCQKAAYHGIAEKFIGRWCFQISINQVARHYPSDKPRKSHKNVNSGFEFI